MRKTIPALAFALVLLSAGCVAEYGGVSAEDPTRTTASPSTAAVETEPESPFYAVRNDRSEAIRVTVYVVDGPVENYTYVRPNGSTVSAATEPWRDPGRRPENYTTIRPSNEVVWSETYVVEPASSLVVRFSGVPDSATIMELTVPNSTPRGAVLTEHGSSHTSERCLISIENPGGSRSMGGCGYDYAAHVHENGTRSVTVDLNRSA